MNWTIKQKLFLGFGLAAILIAASAWVARWAQVRAQETQSEITKTYGIMNDLEHLGAFAQACSSIQRGYLISGNESNLAELSAWRDDATAAQARVIAAMGGDTAQVDLFKRWQDDMLQRRVFVNKLIAANRSQGFAAAKVIFDTGEDDRLLSTMQTDFNTIRAAEASQLSQKEAANVAFQHKMGLIELLSALVAIAVLVVFGMMLTRSIGLNIQIAVELAEAIALKNLAVADGIPASNDEVATAILAINRLKQSMSAALGEVALSSAQVAASGVEIESTSRQIATTTHEEQKNIEQFASSLVEMNATVRDVAEHAEHASAAASDAVSSATSGREVVRKTHELMNRIGESVTTVSADITTLGEVTQNIGEVVGIIQDVAEQTNLLALNAAIEAARAGEQGKGFAVVAQEVRQLAERTATFTKEIAGKIKSVQEGADRAVLSMGQSKTVVSEGVQQFSEVSTALEAIMQRIETAQQGIAMIATATTQQSSATAGLTENIHNITSEVNQMATQVDQTVTACAGVAQLAAGLQRMVDSFQLEDR